MSKETRVALADRVIAEATKLRIAAFEGGDAFHASVWAIQRLTDDAAYIDSRTVESHFTETGEL